MEKLREFDELYLIEGDVFFEQSVLRRLIESVSGNATVLEPYNDRLEGTFVQLGTDGYVKDWRHKSDQEEGYDITDKYKTVNLHKFSSNFVEEILKPELKQFIEDTDGKEPIEKLMRRIVLSEPNAMKGEVLSGEKWCEIDDESDLKLAETVFKRSVDMANWHRIWNGRIANESKLYSEDVEEQFMELKRLTGNDTLKNGGVPYESFLAQYNRLKKMLSKNGKTEIKSFFEVGCGSAPYLMLLEREEYDVGGMDYAAELVKVASQVLNSNDELYCDEAVNLRDDIKYDAVFSTSAFEYFESDEYAKTVLDKMVSKAKKSIAILDVHDSAKESRYVEYRRSVIDNYDVLYEGLTKKFFPKDFFVRYADEKGLDIVIEESCLEGYWNKPFVYDVYLYKGGV
jgi:hypothetical protein